MPKHPNVLLPDHPAYSEAVDAMRRYHAAQSSGAAPEEVERLRLIAEASFQAVTEHQLRAFGRSSNGVH